MAAQHLAAIRIQNHVRVFLEYLRQHPEQRKINRKGGKNYGYDDDASQPDTHFTPMQKLRSKFLTSAYNILHKNEEGCYQNF